MLAGSLKSAFLANMQTSVCLSTHGLTYPWGDTYVSLSENQFLNVHGIPEPPPPPSGTLYFYVPPENLQLHCLQFPSRVLNKFVAANINATRYVYSCYTWIGCWRVTSTPSPHFSHSASSFRWPSQCFHIAPSSGLSPFLDVFVFPGLFSMHFIVWLLLGKLSWGICLKVL